MKSPRVKKSRKTKETDIQILWDLHGSGISKIKTPIPFFNHMLEAFSKHGFFDLTVNANGDVDVDDHHLVEDVGLVLGDLLRTAIGDKKGLTRYGHFTLPMDETLVTVALDLCDRPCLVMHNPLKSGKIKNFDVELVHEFFQAFTNEARINLHIVVHAGKNKHHIVEAMFKAFARALAMAVSIHPRQKGVPSTKGKL